MPDVTLYKRSGRGDWKPVISIDGSDKNAKDTLTGIRQAEINKALASGAQIPDFKVQTGDVEVGGLPSTGGKN